MAYNQQFAAILQLNFEQAERTALLLKSAHDRMHAMMPLTSMMDLSETQKDLLDAFRVRFCDLQDILGTKTFKSILLLEEESTGSQLDTINKMIKRRILVDFNAWKVLRDIRNNFTHDYPLLEKSRMEALNQAYLSIDSFLAILPTIRQYVQNAIGLELCELPKSK